MDELLDDESSNLVMLSTMNGSPEVPSATTGTLFTVLLVGVAYSTSAYPEVLR